MIALTLSGDPRRQAADLAALHTLLDEAPDLLGAPWWVLPMAGGLALASEALGDDLAAYQRRGLPVGEAEIHPEGARLTVGEAVTPISAPRAVDDLISGLPLLPRPGDPPVDEACLVMVAEGEAPQLTLTRLLRLGRGDVQISEWIADDAPRQICFRVPDPPLYLLMRARDEAEGVTAFVRHGQTDLWCQWGHDHPLADLAAARLRRHDQSAWVTADGRWRRRPAQWPEQTIYAAVDARLPAPPVALDAAPAEGEPTRFVVHLRLESAPISEPELWLIDDEALIRLEDLVEESTGALLNRITLARLHSPDGPRHLLRLRGRQPDRLGTRLADLLDDPGYAPLPGTDQILTPVGRQLVPAMRLEALRRLLDLSPKSRAIFSDGPDGVQVFTVPEVDEIALVRFVDYVAATRRVALEALFEESVFAFEALEVDRPVKQGNKALSPPPPPPPRLTPPRKPKARRVQAEAPAPVDEGPGWDDVKILQARIRALESTLIAGDAPAADWREMSRLKGKIGEAEDAAACLEIALFHDGAHCLVGDAAAVDRLGADLRDLLLWRLSHLQLEDSTETVVDLITRELPAGPEASYLGARLLLDALQGRDRFEGVDQRALSLFADEALLTSRRLQWMVLAALSLAHDDPLALTRAKEALVGALNTKGLREGPDIPRFVRHALALESVEGEQLDDASAVAGAQARALRGAWALVEPTVEPLDVHSAFTQAVFSVGFARLGLNAEARALSLAVEEELPVHDRPTGTLLRLYLARGTAYALEASADDQQKAEAQALWRDEVKQITRGLNPVESRAVHVVRRWSRWLNADEVIPTQTYLSGEHLRRIHHAQADPQTGPEVLGTLLDAAVAQSGAVEAVHRLLNLAMSTGKDALITETAQAAYRRLDQRFVTPRSRMTVLGQLIGAAAMVGEGEGVAPLVEDLLVVMPQISAVGDLLLAVTPALEAMRRVGITDQAAQFLHGLREVGERGHRLSAQVAGIAAEGYWMLQEGHIAREILEDTLEAILERPLDPVARFEGASAFADAVRPWPSTERAMWLTRLLMGLPAFRDSFTSRKYFEALKILMLERIVDTTTDTLSFASGRIRTWLEREEQAIRRRIIGDWRVLTDS